MSQTSPSKQRHSWEIFPHSHNSRKLFHVKNGRFLPLVTPTGIEPVFSP